MYTWLGLYNEARTHIVSQCNWTDGALVVYHRYASPRTSRVAGHCVIVDVTRYGRGTCAWRDVACDSRHAVTCSRLYLGENGPATLRCLSQFLAMYDCVRNTGSVCGFLAVILIMSGSIDTMGVFVWPKVKCVVLSKSILHCAYGIHL